MFPLCRWLVCANFFFVTPPPGNRVVASYYCSLTRSPLEGFSNTMIVPASEVPLHSHSPHDIERSPPSTRSCAVTTRPIPSTNGSSNPAAIAWPLGLLLVLLLCFEEEEEEEGVMPRREATAAGCPRQLLSVWVCHPFRLVVMLSLSLSLATDTAAAFLGWPLQPARGSRERKKDRKKERGR